jgi:uncharacterized membrane protein
VHCNVGRAPIAFFSFSWTANHSYLGVLTVGPIPIIVSLTCFQPSAEKAQELHQNP